MEKTKMEHAHEHEQEQEGGVGGVGGVLGCCKKVMQFGEVCTTFVCPRVLNTTYMYIYLNMYMIIFIYTYLCVTTIKVKSSLLYNKHNFSNGVNVIAFS